MALSFSERIGKTSPRAALQTDEMTIELRNSIWNCISRILSFSDPRANFGLSHIKYICEFFFKERVDSIPSYGTTWLRNIFYDENFTWFRVYDLVEFIVQHSNDLLPYTHREMLIEQFNVIFNEEKSGYRFIAGFITPITSKEEIEAIEDSIKQACEKRMYGTQQHLETAVSLFSKRPNPEYRNSIKESICAIEALTKEITGVLGGGLKDALDALDEKIHFHVAFKAGLLKLYGYTSDTKQGIRHVIMEETNLDVHDAKFMLVICSALVKFMIAKADEAGLLK